MATPATAPGGVANSSNRLVARIDATATPVNTTTTLPSGTAFITNNVRGATSQDGSAFWMSGAGSSSSDWPIPVPISSSTAQKATAEKRGTT